MARQKKNPEELEPTKNTQAEIEAALAKASGGAFKPEAVNPSSDASFDDTADTPHTPNVEFDSDVGECDCKCDGTCDCDKQESDAEHCYNKHSIKNFIRDCKNGNITARDCKYWSSKNEDKSIMEYIKSINEKIFNEIQNGSFSTEITFRVAPNDWVNVTKIIEWYESRGFEIRDHKINTPPPQYMNSGSMEHVFKIVWVNA